MYLVDYHTHSKYSYDGQEDIDSMCQEAIQKGLHEIAITDHYDMFKDKKYAHAVDFENLYRDIGIAKAKYEGKLTVRAGIELGQPQVCPDESKRFLEKYELDFIIGSIHNLEDAFDIGEYDFLKKDIRLLWPEYLDALIEMATYYDFDVMGHLTYPMRYVCAQIGIYPNIDLHIERIKHLYQVLIESEKGIEINASGFFQPINRSMPDLELVKLYKTCGGEIITIGCDAHRLEHIGLATKQGLKVAKEAGFKYITTYEKRNPKFRNI